MPPQAQDRTVVLRNWFGLTIAVIQRAQAQSQARKERVKVISHGTANNSVFIKLWLDVGAFNYKSLFCFCG
jgi:hypothetical protein